MPATSFSNLITFSRGTNATVTDRTGRLTYAPHNLLTFSEQFDNAAWTKNAASIAANTTAAPDGSTAADTITENSANDLHVAFSTVTLAASTSYILSFYIKANTRNVAMVRVGGGGFATGPAIKATLTGSGSVSTIEGPVASSSISAVGNGWYRVSMLFASLAAVGVYTPQVGPHNDGSSISYTGNGTGSVYVWGAQLEAVTYQTTPSTYYPTTVKNLLGYSQDFSNAAWTKTRSSITICPYANPVDGLFTAQKLMEDAATGTHGFAQGSPLVANTPLCFSLYVRPDGRNIRVTAYTASNGLRATFNFSTLAVTNGSYGNSTYTSGTITALSNGWYRIALIGIASSNEANPTIAVELLNDTTLSYTGDGNSGIYIYGAQLSDSASLDPYVPTPAAAPSSTAYYGPRFDYDPVTLAAKGILIEEARTNLPLYSEQFDNAYWNKANSSVTANAAVSPDGSNNADKLVENTATSTHTIGVTLIAGSAVYTYSVYVKAAGRSVIRFRDSVNGVDGFFDLGTATSPSGTAVNRTITSVGNGWYRCTMTSSAAVTNPEFGVRLATAVGTENYTGDGTSGVFIYGAQIEAGSFATSYIPTVASSVTRSADVATITGSLFSGWYRQDEGTFVLKLSSQTSGFAYLILASDGTNANRFGLYRVNASMSGLVVSSSSTQMDLLAGSIPSGTTFKAAVTAATNNGNVALNAVTQTPDTSLTMPTTNNTLYIGQFGSVNQLNGHIQSVQYIPTRISDTQLQSLTTG